MQDEKSQLVSEYLSILFGHEVSAVLSPIGQLYLRLVESAL